MQYFKVKSDKIDWLGDRYFKIDMSDDSDKCLQICSIGGEKRGRANAVGIYLISKMTLYSNYMGMNYLESVTKKQFNNKFIEVVKILSTL